MAEQIAAAPAVTVKMAREVIRHLARAADPRVDGRRDDLPDVHQHAATTSPSSAPPRPRTARRATPGAEREPTTDRTSAAAARRSARPRCRPGTFDGVAVFVTGGGTGLGKAIAAEFARLGASIVIASRKPEHLDAGPRPRSRRSARRCSPSRATSATPTRSPPRSTPPTREFGLPGRARQQRGRELPGAGRGHVAQRVAHRRRHHAQRHVLLLAASSAAATSPPARPGSIINVGASYAWTGGPGLRALGRGQGRREEPDRDRSRSSGGRTASR